jgi:hypothetical protein
MHRYFLAMVKAGRDPQYVVWSMMKERRTPVIGTQLPKLAGDLDDDHIITRILAIVFQICLIADMT